MDTFNLGVTYINGMPIGDGFLVAAFFSMIAFILRGLAIDREKAWKTAKSTIQPTLKALDPPVIQTFDGVSGYFWGIIFRLGSVSMFVGAIDFMLFRGAITLWVIRISPLNIILNL